MSQKNQVTISETSKTPVSTTSRSSIAEICDKTREMNNSKSADDIRLIGGVYAINPHCCTNRPAVYSKKKATVPEKTKIMILERQIRRKSFFSHICVAKDISTIANSKLGADNSSKKRAQFIKQGQRFVFEGEKSELRVDQSTEAITSCVHSDELSIPSVSNQTILNHELQIKFQNLQIKKVRLVHKERKLSEFIPLAKRSCPNNYSTRDVNTYYKPLSIKEVENHVDITGGSTKVQLNLTAIYDVKKFK